VGIVSVDAPFSACEGCFLFDQIPDRPSVDLLADPVNMLSRFKPK
jgi:hypothetical protein